MTNRLASACLTSLLLVAAHQAEAIARAVVEWSQEPSTEPARPAQPPTQADALRVAVETAREQLETDPAAAIEALDRLAAESIQLRRMRPLVDAERPVHSELFRLRARGYLLLLNNEKVEESFRELLRIEPLFQGQLAPREQEIIDGLRAREGGFLEITSPEPGATVLVEGIPVGVTGDTAVRVMLLAGEYEIRLEKEGFQAASGRASLAPGGVVAVRDLAPQRRVPPVAFLTDREDVEVMVNNGPAGRTVRLATLRGEISPEESVALARAVVLAGFDAGTAGGFLLRNPPVDQQIVVRFRRDCFVEEARTIVVTSDALVKLAPTESLLWFGQPSAVRLQADVGTLRITSTPSDADVFLDGQLAGRTPFERDSCAGQRGVRIRHRIGSYSTSVAITRGRTQIVDAVLKPGLAFLGAVDTVQDTLRPSAELTATIDRALAAAITSFNLATRREQPVEIQRWTDLSTAELVAASDRSDQTEMTRLLRLASDSYDAPLLVAAVRRPAPGDRPIDLLVFWSDHTGVDRVRWLPSAQVDPSAVLARLDAPVDARELVYENVAGLRVVDTGLPDAPLMIVTIDPGSPGVAAGLKVADGIEAVDGTAMNATQLAERIRQKRPGDLVTLRVAGTGTAPPRQVQIPIQQKPRRAPVFDPSFFGNALIAKLTAASITATSAPDRDLLTFNLALARMRFGEWRSALELLAGVANPPVGTGVGRGAVLFFRARCHEELGEQDRAAALYSEAADIPDQVLTDDGASVASVARRRLAALGAAPGAAEVAPVPRADSQFAPPVGHMKIASP